MKYVDQTVIAKPNWCVPAALEMVLKHYGYNKFSQSMIAEQLEIIPAKEEIDHSKWGSQIKKNTINDFFSANAIALHERFISINLFLDEYFLEDKIQVLLENNVSIICGFNYSYLYGNKEDTFQHVAIIVAVKSENKVLLLDPGPRDAGYKIVDIGDLFASIKKAQDGLWCIY